MLVISLVVLALLVASAMATWSPRSAPAARAAVLSGTTPFEASFAEQTIARVCANDICQVTILGKGTATHLSSAIELINRPVDSATPFCHQLHDTRALTAADGSGSLFVTGTGQACPGTGNNAQLMMTWTITGGTGRFSGASGTGTESSISGAIMAVHYAGIITLPGSGIPSLSGHFNYK